MAERKETRKEASRLQMRIWEVIKKFRIIIGIAVGIIVIVSFVAKLCGPEATGNLAGYVRDDSTKKPVVDAQVEVTPKGHIGTTQRDYSRSTGEYAFISLPIGYYDFAVSHSEYEPDPYTDIVKILEAKTVPRDVYLLPKKALKEGTLSPISSWLFLPDWAKSSTNLGIEVTLLSEPQLAKVDFRGIGKQTVLMDARIKNTGDETVYLDLDRSYLAGQLLASELFVPLLSYDLTASLLTECGLPGPVLRLEPQQELVGTIAFGPKEGEEIPIEVKSVFPVFWGIKGDNQFQISPAYTPGFPFFPID